MGLGYGHPMGLRSTDVMGLDVQLAIAKYLPRAFGPRFPRRRCSATRLPLVSWAAGAGRGFYTFT